MRHPVFLSVLLVMTQVMTHGACSLLFQDASGGSDQWLEGWTARQEITIDRRRFGDDLIDFPVAVIFDANTELAVTSSGTDLAFTLAGSTELLSHEIERFNLDTGALTAWVRVPVLPGETLTRLHLYYGNRAADFLERVEDTWIANFAGVWHLSEDSATEPQTLDSGPNRNHGQFMGMPATVVDAPTNAALDFDGDVDCVTIGDPLDGSLDFGLDQSFSFSVWVEVESSVNSFDTVWSKGGNAGDSGYHLILGTGNWQASTSIDVTTKDQVVHGQEPTFLGRWVHLVTVVDRSADRMIAYVDGVKVDERTPLTVEDASTDNDALIGSLTACGQQPMNGGVDEMRVYSMALSESWVAAEHANLDDPSFLTVASEKRP